MVRCAGCRYMYIACNAIWHSETIHTLKRWNIYLYTYIYVYLYTHIMITYVYSYIIYRYVCIFNNYTYTLFIPG